MATKEEEDGIEGVTTDRADLLLGNLGESEGGAALQVDIVGKGECGQRGQWWSFEEVGRVPVFKELEREQPEFLGVRSIHTF